MTHRARTLGSPALAAALAATLVAGCAARPIPTQVLDAGTLQLSSAFEDGGPIPSRSTCDGEDVSPPLAWTDPPADAASFALVVEDLDAAGFVHWVLTDIPGDARELPEGEGDAIGKPGLNDFGRAGWGGPCPASGEHRYTFTLFALTEPVGAVDDADELRSLAAEGRTLDTARLTGVYARP